MKALQDRQRYIPKRWNPGKHLGNEYAPWMQQRRPIHESGDGGLLGLSVLSALSVAGIHTAVSPSYVTLRSIASTPEDRAAAIEGLWIGLGAGTITSGAIWLVFGEWLPALASEIVALALFGIDYYAVTSQPLDSIPPGAAPGGETVQK